MRQQVGQCLRGYKGQAEFTKVNNGLQVLFIKLSELIACMLKTAAEIAYHYAAAGNDCNLIVVYGLTIFYQDNYSTIYRMTIN